MSGRRWIASTLGVIVLVMGLVIGFCYEVDPYGVLRNSKGRKLAVYQNDRRAKYFLNQRYVPSNFDGLLIGASEIVNWNPLMLTDFSIYNEGLQGACASEERFMVDQALPTGHFKLALIVLSPPMTSSHEFKDGLESVHEREIAGSIHVLANAAAHLAVERHLHFHKSDSAPNGTVPFDSHKSIFVRKMEPEYFQIDPVALADYQALISSLESHGAKIVYLIPPVYQPFYALNQADYHDYLKRILHSLPTGRLIDFNDTRDMNLTGNKNLFFDCFHTNPKGAAIFSELLARRMSETN